MISWAVVAHHSRLPAATDLAKTLDAVLALDHGDIGAGANHLRAWELTETLDADWAAVVEDDALPVPGAPEQALHALTAAPTPVVSFYLGTTRPRRWQERIAPAIATADRAGACWLTTTHAIHAVAIALHTSVREDWLDFAHTSPLPIDERMAAWCIARGHRVAYTWPSLFDHEDGGTLVEHANPTPAGPRKAWRTGTRDTWTSKAVKL